MPIDITMPALSPTMETGTLAKWLVKVGDAVKSGGILAEIETDKATMEVESIDEGTVAELLFADGSDAIPVGTVIARLSGEGEAAAPAAEAPAAAPLTKAATPDSPTPGPSPEGEGSSKAIAPATGVVAAPSPSPSGEGRETARSDGPGVEWSPDDDTARTNASPLARRLAEAKGIDLAALKGSGPNGRIVKTDIDRAQAGAARPATAQPGAGQGSTAQSPDARPGDIRPGNQPGDPQPGDTQFRDGQSGVTRPNASKPAVAPTSADGDTTSPAAGRPAPAASSPPTGSTTAAPAGPATSASPAPASAAAASLPPPAGVPMEAIKLSNMRRTIARRLAESKATVPHFYLTVDVRLDALLKLRGELNTSLDATGVKLSVNDLLIKALGLALVAVPDANVQFAGDTLYKFGRADVSVAVAIPGGLITPVIVDAANKRLSVIASELKDLAARAKDGKLKPEEYQGGTASISNLGMFGIKQFDAVINPPQGLILAVGAGEKRPYIVDDALAVATVLSATGSFDHRAIDGATGAQLMSAFKALVEAPLGMLA